MVLEVIAQILLTFNYLNRNRTTDIDIALSDVIIDKNGHIKLINISG